MVKAAGVSAEPELYAAIEQLLADERGRAPPQVDAAQTPHAVPIEPAAGAPEPALPVQRDEPEKPPQRAGGWRGLFSRKERRTAPTRVEELPMELPNNEPEESPAEPEPAAVAPPEPTMASTPSIHTDAIPRTGDDWFDRALSGLDEVYDQAGERGDESRGLTSASPRSTMRRSRKFTFLRRKERRKPPHRQPSPLSSGATPRAIPPTSCSPTARSKQRRRPASCDLPLSPISRCTSKASDQSALFGTRAGHAAMCFGKSFSSTSSSRAPMRARTETPASCTLSGARHERVPPVQIPALGDSR